MRRSQRSTAKNKFPQLDIPFELPYPPMEAKLREAVPSGKDWQFEPKWDGFRALIFKDGNDVVIQSKSGQPLGRYFPELVAAIRGLKVHRFVLDGEIVVQIDGRLSFDTLQLRLHPAQSRIDRLAKDTPVNYFAFDLLLDASKSRNEPLVKHPLSDRRKRLEKLFKAIGEHDVIRLSPATRDRDIGVDWFEHGGRLGMDGVMAKQIDAAYRSGERDAMVKVKHFRDADCVVGGFRYRAGTKSLSVLALGLYDEDGLLHHVGNAGGFSAAQRREIKDAVEPLAGGEGFSGKSPGISRWSRGATEFVPVEPALVCAVRYDYFTARRFRHATKFLRWRPDKKPKACTFREILREIG